MSQIEHKLTVPAGPVSAKYRDFCNNEDFLEMAFIGTMNTSKSSALVDWLILSGLNYPGANLVLTRAKLSDLRRTTLTKYLSRAGKVLVDNFNKNEAVIEFPEINGKKSTLFMFGLDRTDLTEVLKSFEPFRVAIEESNEVPSLAFDMLLSRLRQKVEHRERTNRWLIARNAKKWGCDFHRAQKAMEIPDEKLDSPHYGANQLKHVFNPEGNDHTWKRVVGVPYPTPDEMGKDWIKKHVGVREFYIPPTDIGSYTFEAGDYAGLPDGSRGVVANDDPKTGKVEFIRTPETQDGKESLEYHLTAPKKDVTFIGQRAAIFAFTDENWSRNISSDKNFLYMQDPAIRKQYFEAKIDTKKGLVFPEFERQTHVVSAPKRDIPRDLRAIVSVDHGLRHPTVALFGVLTKKPTGGVLILKEYMVQGRSASENAYAIKGLVPPYLEQVAYYGDPSMWRREATSMSSVAEDYLQAGIGLYPADNNQEYTINLAKELFTVKDDFRQGDRSPRLFISEECENLIHALETCTHQHLASSRDNWVVDMIDGLRYLCAGVSNEATMADSPQILKPHVKVWDWGEAPQ